MKILVLSAGNPLITKNGRGIFEFDQAKALKEIGEDVRFLSIDLRSLRRKRKFGKSVFSFEEMECTNVSFPLGKIPLKMHNYFGYKQFKKGLKTILKTGWKPDVIHCHFGLQTGYFAYRCKEEYGIPYVITEHDSSINAGQINEKQKELLQKIYDSANGRIAVSKPFVEKLNDTFKRTFTYIPNIVDTSAFDYSNVVNKNKEPFTFSSIGALDDRKGFDLLLKSFKETKGQFKDIKLKIIGSGNSLEKLQELAKELHIENDVSFLGQLDRKQISDELKNSNCFALASRNETFGVVYIEAMYLGLPVIATRCGGPESFVNDDNGLVVDVDDINQLSTAMKYMISNSDKYNNDDIHQYVVDNFSPTVIAKQIVNYIKENV